jgi:hypothetical protein
MQQHLRSLFTADRGWLIEVMDQSTFLENIPMVKITKVLFPTNQRSGLQMSASFELPLEL